MGATVEKVSAIRTAILFCSQLLLVASLGFGREEGERSILLIRIPDGAHFELIPPDGWEATTAIAGPTLTVRIVPVDGGDAVMLLTVVPTESRSENATPKRIRAAVVEEGERALASAMETELEIVEARGTGALLYLYHLTDRKPEHGPGDYREVDQGMALIDQYVVSVTILTHPGDEHLAVQAKSAIVAARVHAPDSVESVEAVLRRIVVGANRAWIRGLRSLDGKELARWFSKEALAQLASDLETASSAGVYVAYEDAQIDVLRVKLEAGGYEARVRTRESWSSTVFRQTSDHCVVQYSPESIHVDYWLEHLAEGWRVVKTENDPSNPKAERLPCS